MAQAIPSSIHCTTAWEFYMVVTRGRDAIVCTKIGGDMVDKVITGRDYSI
jgi:hypothetical protein